MNMDLSDINKESNTKRVSSDAEKFREEMSRKLSNIIKPMVAQDAACHELKEQTSGVEGKLKRLQQNMVDVQMQYEKLFARDQDELRLRRPETLNKVAGAQSQCDALEQHVGCVQAAHAQHAACTRADAAADWVHSCLEREQQPQRPVAEAVAKCQRAALLYVELQRQVRQKGGATLHDARALLARSLAEDLPRIRTEPKQDLEAKRADFDRQLTKFKAGAKELRKAIRENKSVSQHDNNALSTPPRPPRAPTRTRALCLVLLARAHDALDPRFEAQTTDATLFEAMSRGVAPYGRAPADDDPAAVHAPSRASDDALSLTQVRKEKAVRAFFRFKRIEYKEQKFKRTQQSPSPLVLGTPRHFEMIP